MNGKTWYRVVVCSRVEDLRPVIVTDENRSTVTLENGETYPKTGRNIAYRPSRFEAATYAVSVLQKQYERAQRKADTAFAELQKARQLTER